MTKPSAGKLIVHSERCHGCQACMIACSVVKDGRANPAWARLHVIVDVLGARQSIQYCRQCRKAPCAEACPAEAIQRTEAGYWAVDGALCTGCGACVAACPFGVICLAPDGAAVKCDTCAGNPQCVASCPSGALAWHAPAAAPISAE
mgnify:FL=1